MAGGASSNQWKEELRKACSVTNVNYLGRANCTYVAHIVIYAAHAGFKTRVLSTVVGHIGPGRGLFQHGVKGVRRWDSLLVCLGTYSFGV